MWIFFLFIFTSNLLAFPILHFIKPESTFSQITTLDSCSTYLINIDMVGCNPALFPYQKDEGLRIGLSTITDGKSVEVGQKLLFDPIKEDFLRELFEKRPFNSWGANSFIQLRTSKFYISYDPLSINADVYVFNPSSPEVAMSLIKSNRLNLKSGIEVINNDILKSSIGIKAYYYRSEFFQDSVFLSDLTSQNAKDLVKFSRKNGVAGDIGTFFQFSNAYFPKVSLQVKNLNSPIHNKDEEVISERQMRPILVYEMYSKLGVGYDFRTNWGIINTELNAPFNNIFEDLYNEYISGSVSYTLSRFSTHVAYSKYQNAFGFNFGSKVASIGIFYGVSQPLGDFSSQKESLSGVRGEISL